jgi:hypothetical protein
VATKGKSNSELDKRWPPLTDDEIMAMGYEPTPNGWKAFRKDLIPAPTPQPEQHTLEEMSRESEPAPDLQRSADKTRKPRKGRSARPSRKPRGV